MLRSSMCVAMTTGLKTRSLAVPPWLSYLFDTISASDNRTVDLLFGVARFAKVAAVPQSMHTKKAAIGRSL